MLDVKPLLIKTSTDFPTIHRGKLEVLQVNLGYLCNLSCTHCHVNAGPKRTELMGETEIAMVIDVLKKWHVNVLDLTGGAPEMNPHFSVLVEAARELGVTVIDRCNLTILTEPGFESLASFLAEQRVKVVASLPCYTEQNVDSQRGKGVFEQSIEGLRQLNNLGYGQVGSDLVLDLAYNPGGAFLPPPQQQLETDYKKELQENFGVSFNELLTITNMPISRFGSMLMSKGLFDDYMRLLRDAYKQDNLVSVMCRNTLSVDWQGYLFDCDFNQMLGLPIEVYNTPIHLSMLLAESFDGHPIKVADHCFGCTAGQGSSCSGALN